MKKFNLLILTISLTFFSSYAQNTFPSNGNIGIGTASPTSGLTIQTEGANVNDGALFLVNSVNSGFGGNATLAGIKTLAGDGGQYNFLKLQNAGGVKLLINGAGNVGIGTASPVSKLHTQISNYGLNLIGGFQNLNGTETGGNAVGIGFVNEALGSWWKAAIVHERTGGYGIGSLKFLVNSSVDNSTVTLSDVKMTILSSGFVGIGTDMPKEALSVNGSIRAKTIKVEITNWPDYILKKDYLLPSLSFVKNYIDQNQHLPDIPSEEDVTKEGLNLGEMNRLLLKKVEELTLYLIEKDAEVKQLQQDVVELKKQKM